MKPQKIKTIKSMIIRNAQISIIIYLSGLIFLISFILPKLFTVTHEKLNEDILLNTGSELSEMFSLVHNQYLIITRNEELTIAMEDIKSLSDLLEKSPAEVTRYYKALVLLDDQLTAVLSRNFDTISKISVHINTLNINSDYTGFNDYFAERGNNKVIFFGLRELPQYKNSIQRYYLRYPIYGRNGFYLGSLCFCISEKKHILIPQENSIFILEKDDIVFSNNAFDLKYADLPKHLKTDLKDRTGTTEEINGKKYYTTSGSLEFLNWTIISIIPFERFDNTISQLKLHSILIFLVAFIATLYPMFIFSDLISENVLRIVHEMDIFMKDKKERLSPNKSNIFSNKLYAITKKYTLSDKIFFYNIFTIILPIFVVSFVVFIRCGSVAEYEYANTAKILGKYFKYSIENKLNSYSIAQKTIMTDNQIMELLYNYSLSSDKNERLKIYNEFGNKVSNEMISRNVFEFNYFDTDGNLILSWPYISSDNSKNIGFLNSSNNSGIALINSATGKYTLNIVKRMFLTTDTYRGGIGFCALGINEDYLSGTWNKSVSVSKYCIADSEKTIFVTNDASANGLNIDEYNTIRNKNNLYIRENLSDLSLEMIMVFSKDVLSVFKLKMFGYLLLLNLCIYLLTLLLTKRLNSYILEPITKVNDTLENNVNAVYHRNKGDELDKLVVSVNRMKTRIETLIDEVYKHKITEKELELKALQSQITPHFLYNVLEVISSLVDIGDDKAGKLILLLSRFFRQGISRGKSVITLQEEIEYTKVYLKIHQFLLENALQVSWDVSPDLFNCEIINFSIQPILENSFKHGMLPEADILHLSIKAYSTSDFIKIAVKDNGKGIERAKLELLRNRLYDNTNSNNEIGLKNVHERLKLHFGESYGLKIYSVYNRGTLVVIKIPRKAY